MPSSSEAIDFLVERSNLRHCKLLHSGPADKIPLAAEEVQLQITAFAFTANNITYAVTGDMLSYWSFFPTEPGWGKVPVWGFADVVGSQLETVPIGERVFGYFPMSTHVVLQPSEVRHGGFVDLAAHRQELPAVYNQYTLALMDRGYEPQHEDQQMLFRPLFMTAFLLDDFLADNDFFAAHAVILSSASSKTAIGLAHLLHRDRRAQCEVIGLTSPRNADFVRELGCYDRVVLYEDIGSLPAQPTVFVDMAGDGNVVHALHHHLRDDMKHSCIVGATHWEQRGQGGELPGAPPTFFFAPTQLQKRTKEWGPDGLHNRHSNAWRHFLQFIGERIRVVHGHGPAAVERVYLDTLEGRSRPDLGNVLSLSERP